MIQKWLVPALPTFFCPIRDRLPNWWRPFNLYLRLKNNCSKRNIHLFLFWLFHIKQCHFLWLIVTRAQQEKLFSQLPTSQISQCQKHCLIATKTMGFVSKKEAYVKTLALLFFWSLPSWSCCSTIKCYGKTKRLEKIHGTKRFSLQIWKKTISCFQFRRHNEFLNWF